MISQESPLRSFTKRATVCRDMNYWKRLEKFKLYSHQRRIERFKCIYVWKSMNGLTPSLNLEWNNAVNRSGYNLKTPSIVNMTGSIKTLVDSSMRSEGVKLFNSLPDALKVWDGSFEIFKMNLDKFLEGVPDNPRTETLRPDCTDYSGNPSNSIKDWD